MSHHYSGPDFGFPRGDARLDFTDLYAFPKPGDTRKSILIMNVHPSAVVDPPGPTTAEPFTPEGLYEFKIDTDGDAVADIAYPKLDSAGGRWVQADRGALPAQAVLLVGAEREAYLAGEPADDARFVAGFAHALEHTGGYTPEEARRTAGTLLPDILSYDPTRPASFPRNGRTLTDDAGDAFLAIPTNGRVTQDKVETHGDLLAEFPYLGLPHST
jgi:Domain of unknown function (DUF4331)